MAKRGRPTEYRDNLPDQLRSYAVDCLDKHRVPWLEEFCQKNNISERTFRHWCKEYDQLSEAHDYLMMIQKMILKQLCITKGAHVAGAIFLLKANHGLIETEKVQHTGPEEEPLNIIFTDVATWRRAKENAKRREAQQVTNNDAKLAGNAGHDWTNYSKNPLTESNQI